MDMEGIMSADDRYFGWMESIIPGIWNSRLGKEADLTS